MEEKNGQDFQLFPQIDSQIFFDFDQKRLALHSFNKAIKTKFTKMEVSVATVKQGFLFSWPWVGLLSVTTVLDRQV